LLEVAKQNWTNGGSFGFTYTAAGRPTQETDPSTGSTITSGSYSRQLQARQMSYGYYGRLTGLTLPEG